MNKNERTEQEIPAVPAHLNRIHAGDCIQLLHQLPDESIDFVLTDPPYLVRYRARDGRSVRNDDTDAWLNPAFQELYRVLKPDTFAVTFYGWHRADRFLSAYRSAGFAVVGHLVFAKGYASSSRFVRYCHESAYLLAKGFPAKPANPIPDVIPAPYSGNRLHPTQKPVSALLPLVESFSKPGQIVLDPFCGSGSSLAAAKQLRRQFIGFEIDMHYAAAAARRLKAA